MLFYYRCGKILKVLFFYSRNFRFNGILSISKFMDILLQNKKESLYRNERSDTPRKKNRQIKTSTGS